MKRTLHRRVRLHLALSELPLLCVVFWALTLGFALRVRRFRSVARSFPYKLLIAYMTTYVLIALTVVEDLNWPRVLVMQGGALALTVTGYSMARVLGLRIGDERERERE